MTLEEFAKSNDDANPHDGDDDNNDDEEEGVQTQCAQQ